MGEPVGEDAWLALVDEASRTAGDLEQRIGVVELYKRALAAEPWSNKLWLAYCEWVWSLHTDCQNGDAGWPEEEQMLGQELFSLETALDVWQQGAQATQYRLSDGHELWNRWISIEQEQLSGPDVKERVERIKRLFLDRLQIPHATWEETSQMFSTFITKYDEPAWESTMVEVTKLAKTAKELYSYREPHELTLAKANDSGDVEQVKLAMRSYLDWETAQAVRKTKKSQPSSPPILCVALFERALASTPLGLESGTWEDYITFLSVITGELPSIPLPSVISVVQRATSHCPWSGPLWARYILTAEAENLPFATLEQIKHSATNTGVLDRDGMDGVIQFYLAWSGYLKRRTIAPGATDEDIDVADMGLRSALESVEEWGQRRHGKDGWKGDPLFRIERIFIRYLTQKGLYRDARDLWKQLIRTQGDSYDFWQQYYLWEMTVWTPNSSPSVPTAVLSQAVHRHNLDWPEKVMEIYVRHCNNHEGVEELIKAMDTVHRVSKSVAKRRQKEAAEAAAMYAQQQPQTAAEPAAVESPSSSAKRKREPASEEPDGVAKRSKNEKVPIDHKTLQEQHLKRDRENTTILVTNIPPETTQTKVRQYFREYGHMNSITLKTEADKQSSTALIEFRTPEDVQSASLRDGKYFGDRQIRVHSGTGLTLYVTNFPPTADDAYLRKLFKDCGEIFSIRWPSLKYNTTRRFCYISFRTQEAASAATELDGQSLGGVYKLVAKYSDPANKKNREGAMAEGREIHVTGIDQTLTEDDLKEVFGKYGKIERVRILKNLSGESKGAGFISFEKQEEAAAALALDKTKLKSRILTVETSNGTNYKPTATVRRPSASPAPDMEGNTTGSASLGAEAQSSTYAQHAQSRIDITHRTIALMNIPDTVNDARVRAIAEPYGNIVKLVLRPDHQGAIIEYADVASAGRAALGLENHEIVPGRSLRTGGMKDLFGQQSEIRTDKIQVGKGNKKPPASFMQPAAPVRRPGPSRRGGLGVKRGLGYAAPKPNADNAEGIAEPNGSAHGEGNNLPKSNADFKAMFVSGGKQ